MPLSATWLVVISRQVDDPAHVSALRPVEVHGLQLAIVSFRTCLKYPTELIFIHIGALSAAGMRRGLTFQCCPETPDNACQM